MNQIIKFIKGLVLIIRTPIYRVTWEVKSRTGVSLVKANTRPEALRRMAGGLTSDLNMSSPRAVRKAVKMDAARMGWVSKVKFYIRGR